DTACRLPFFFFFQAEDGIRDFHVTGVQTCALPICGKLVPFPSSPGSALKSPLLSPAGKARALAEPLVPRGTTADESVSSFLRRRFGAEVDRVFGEGLVSGVVAGDPRRLSMGALFPGLVALERRHGSLLRGLMSQQRDAR